MKKFFVLFAAAALVLSACNGNEKKAEPAAEPAPAVAEAPVTVEQAAADLKAAVESGSVEAIEKVQKDNELTESFKAAKEEVVAKAKETADAAKEAGQGAVDAAKDKVNEATDAAKQAGQDAVDAAKDKVNEATDAAKQAGKDAVDKAANKAKDLLK